MHTVQRRRLVRATGLAGVLASVVYAIGDVLMLGQEERPDRHPAVAELGRTALSTVPSSTARLTAGALAGVYATPLYLAGVWHLHEGLAPAGPRRALPPALLLAGAWTWASFVHGSYLHTGLAFKTVEALAGDARGRETALAGARASERATVAAFVPLGLVEAVASAQIAVAVRSGRTAYPRWSAPLVAPLPPIAAAVALTATHVLPGRARHALQGAGFSLGHLVQFAASTALLWRSRTAGTGDRP